MLGNAFLIPVTMIGYANVDWVYVKWVHSPTATVRTTRLTSCSTECAGCHHTV